MPWSFFFLTRFLLEQRAFADLNNDITHAMFATTRLFNELVNLGFYALIVYFNLFYLIPNYLTRKKFGTYLTLLLLATFIITPLRVIFFYFRFADQPTSQQGLIGNLDLFFVLTFTVGGVSTVLQIVTDWFRQLREKQELEKVASKSHRDRIEEFNEKLGNLTEHNDIPRVSAAGNG